LGILSKKRLNELITVERKKLLRVPYEILKEGGVYVTCDVYIMKKDEKLIGVNLTGRDECGLEQVASIKKGTYVPILGQSESGKYVKISFNDTELMLGIYLTSLLEKSDDDGNAEIQPKTPGEEAVEQVVGGA
jgi:hypothetical protein